MCPQRAKYCRLHVQYHSYCFQHFMSFQENKSAAEHDSANRHPLCVHREHGVNLRTHNKTSAPRNKRQVSLQQTPHMTHVFVNIWSENNHITTVHTVGSIRDYRNYIDGATKYQLRVFWVKNMLGIFFLVSSCLLSIQ